MIEFNNLPVRLLPINPRYTSFQEIDFKRLKFEDYNEDEVAEELLRYEGDFQDLFELIEGIIKNGFLYLNDKILIHSDTKGENYYVLEGNRRLLSVKLINREINFRNNISEYYDSYSNKPKNEIERKSNISRIEELLKNYNKKVDVKREWFLDVSKEQRDVIWQAIYSKHIGEQVGKRNWSRAKYFDDLLKMYKDFLKRFADFDQAKIEAIKELSKLFGKKIGIIKNDLKSAIWIIKSIEIYNNFHKEEPIDLNNMEVSGYELVLSKKLWVNGSEKRMREILGIQIDDKGIEIKYNENISSDNFKKIIGFLIENALNKNITTREIKEGIIDELGELIGYTFTQKKSLNSLYKELSEKEKSQSLTHLEKVKLQSLKNLKSNPIDINEFDYDEHDSKFVKSIKYTIRNDLKTLSHLKFYREDEYPFTNVAHTIRNVIDLFLLELVHKMDIEMFLNDLKIERDKAKHLWTIQKYYGDSKKHNVNKITSVFSNSVMSQGSTEVRDAIILNLNKNYGNRLKKLDIDLDSETLKASFLTLLNFKKFDREALNNFTLLNNLVHKPYYGFENSTNIDLIDNLNIMFDTVKAFLTLWKIWKIK